MAVISGGAAAHAWSEPGVLVLSLLVFAWTPTEAQGPGDYTLTIRVTDDVNVTMRQAAWWVAVHTLATGFVALALSFHRVLGVGYLIPVLLLTLQLTRLTLRLLHRPEGKVALDLFKFSNIYLGIVQLIVIFLPLFGAGFNS